MSTPNGVDLGINPDAERTVQLAQRPRQSFVAPPDGQPQPQAPAGQAFAGQPYAQQPVQWSNAPAGAWPPVQPFMQHGNGYAQASWAPTYPQPNNSRRNLMAIAGVSVLALTAVVVTVVMAGGGDSGSGGTSTPPASKTTTTAKPAPVKRPIPATALPRVMLTGSELSDAVGTTMTPGTMWDSLSDPKLVDDECVVVALPASTRMYRGSGYTGVQTQAAESVNKDPRMNQSVIAFPDDEAATEFVTNQARPAWDKCANRTVNFQTTDPKNPLNVSWNVGAVADTAGLMTVTRTEEGSTSGWECHQGMTSRRNLVLDFYVCGHGITDTEMTAVVDQFDKKVARQK